MRVLDKDNNEIKGYDLDLGYLVQDSILIAHHPAIEYEPAVEEEYHYEVIKEYPNGGKDLEIVIDVPGKPAIPAQEAWDEYEDILRYIPYTEEELQQIRNEVSLEELVYTMLGLEV